MKQDVVPVTSARSGSVEVFDPFRTKIKIAGLKAAIAHSIKIKDWPTSEKGIEALIAEQKAFVALWRRIVTPRRNGNLNNGPVSPKKGKRENDELSMADAEGLFGIRNQQVSLWSKGLEDEDLYRLYLRKVAWAKAWGDKSTSTRDLIGQSDQNDWRTPRKFLEAARKVMGGIDLDPASSAEANETVKADRFYTEAENGLEQPWKGRVWLNPPYGGEARHFVERLLKEFQVGNVTAACTLLNSHPTETKWFQQLFDYPICFVAGRIDFGGPSRDIASSSTHGSAIAYLGESVDDFAHVFGKFGAVVRRVS